MSFTRGNDVNLLQESDAAVVGAGAGNDRYVLEAALLRAGQKLTISDAQGTNTLHLVGGLEIVSSLVAASALQLTLNNGAVITVLGAGNFNFQTGGNAISGAGGLVQDYATFAQDSLGVSLPTPGIAPVQGATVSVNEAGGTSSLLAAFDAGEVQASVTTQAGAEEMVEVTLTGMADLSPVVVEIV